MSEVNGVSSTQINGCSFAWACPFPHSDRPGNKVPRSFYIQETGFLCRWFWKTKIDESFELSPVLLIQLIQRYNIWNKLRNEVNFFSSSSGIFLGSLEKNCFCLCKNEIYNCGFCMILFPFIIYVFILLECLLAQQIAIKVAILKKKRHLLGSITLWILCV